MRLRRPCRRNYTRLSSFFQSVAYDGRTGCPQKRHRPASIVLPELRSNSGWSMGWRQRQSIDRLLFGARAVYYRDIMKHSSNTYRFPHRMALLLLGTLFSFLVASCNGVIGYSVVLWNIPEYQLADGTVVPVYVKSNISQVYVIKDSATGENKEVPIWKLSEPTSRKKADELAASHAAFRHKYAKCVLDGLPVRAEPTNGAKQVYRLRKDEILRTLHEGQGDIPTNGKEQLSGTWLRVLTSGGTEGWCFSQNLRIFEMNADGSYGEGAAEAQVQQEDAMLESFLKKKWYPDYYQQMIDKKQIDLSYMNPLYGFDTGSETGTVALRLFNVNASYPYTGVTKTSGGAYKFNDVPIQVTVRGDSYIIVQHTDSKGKRHSYSFITLDGATDIQKLVSEEQDRRARLYNALYTAGPSFTSSNYGTLSFAQDGSFSWSSYNLLVPSVIAASAAGSGTVQLQYFLPANLKSEWDGILTFSFQGMERQVNFLYRRTDSGLRLAVATVTVLPDTATGRNTVSISLPVNSLVMFFQN